MTKKEERNELKKKLPNYSSVLPAKALVSERTVIRYFNGDSDSIKVKRAAAEYLKELKEIDETIKS